MNRVVLNELMNARKKALSAIILDTILAALLIISFVINCCTLGSTNKGGKKRVKRDR